MEPPLGERDTPLLFHITPLNGSSTQYYVRSRAHCEYENGYVIFDRIDGNKEVWRLVSNDDDFTVGGSEYDTVASHAPPDEGQRRVSAVAATMHRRYAPRGHFRPWAKISFPETTHAYRFAYPTLLCANSSHAFLHDVRTGALVQTIDLFLTPRQPVCYVDVNERHAFVCDPEVLHVYTRHGGDGRAAGAEVLRISRIELVQEAVELNIVPGNPFFTALPLRSVTDIMLPLFMAGASTVPSRVPVIHFISGHGRRRRLLTYDFPFSI
jgi:hypothetical protein